MGSECFSFIGVVDGSEVRSNFFLGFFVPGEECYGHSSPPQVGKKWWVGAQEAIPLTTSMRDLGLMLSHLPQGPSAQTPPPLQLCCQ